MKGFVDKSWNHIDGIAAVLSSLSNGDDGSKQMDAPESARHYYILFFSAWAGRERPLTFIAA
eukprot:4837335-Ditylum_brightwellii.AAC.1